MSFTVSANTNMQFLWDQTILGSLDGSTKMTYIQAYCVYDRTTSKKGTTFIYSYSGGTLVSVEQLRYPDVNLRGVVPCYRD